MLALLRIILGFALFAVFAKAADLARTNPNTEGTTDAGYMALAVILGIANAVVWAPLIGRWMADPITGGFTSGHPADFRNRVLQFANKLGARGWRRSALFFAFLDGIRHPDLPSAFVLGLKLARSGSWLEKVFAREVWRFDNAENCVRAWNILRTRGLEPGVHRRAEVNLLIHSLQREKLPDPESLVLSPAPPPPALRRNAQIRLFDPPPGTPGSDAGSGAGTPVPNPAPEGTSPSAKEPGPPLT